MAKRAAMAEKWEREEADEGAHPCLPEKARTPPQHAKEADPRGGASLSPSPSAKAWLEVPLQHTLSNPFAPPLCLHRGLLVKRPFQTHILFGGVVACCTGL